MEIINKKILVVGMGMTGRATVDFLVARGAKVFFHDDRVSLDEAEINGAKKHTDGFRYDLLIPSPGVPPWHPLLVEAIRSSVLVMSEVELAFAFSRMPIVAITGTNGKTTTTSLIGEMLQAGGKKVFIGGNIGNPFIKCVSEAQDEDFAVLELSSFQLLHTHHFRAAFAVMLNITRDHTDYHGSLEDYSAAKGKIFTNQRSGDLAIINYEDPLARVESEKSAGTKLYFSSHGPVSEGIFVQQDRLVRICDGNVRYSYDATLTSLKGAHNRENIMASILTAEACGIDREAICAAIGAFRSASHRLELFATHNGVEFYDDSKGTNVDATLRAVETFSVPVVLLMGGRDKDGDFARLIPILREKVRLLILFGEAREIIAAKLNSAIPTLSFPSLQEASRASCSAARAGEVVLLSPACASFDEFANYKERGKFFQRTIKEICYVQ
ncbi:MAG: UDP-N-acetylmuramoyl-L-alanine--D-glutamate ligase [Deltaproteobacteria bacterium]|nr:UDP-N-acetylmuramoyl-L-alanine--D-glutamate ligase [Deltaproteobacteria bacterium]